MNSLHLFLVALLLHRALVWHDERRDSRPAHRRPAGRPVRVEPRPRRSPSSRSSILFVLWDARREIARATDASSSGAAGAFALGLLPYLYLPLRAMAGPADVYGGFLTWNGFFDARQRRAVPRRHEVRLGRQRPAAHRGDADRSSTTSCRCRTSSSSCSASSGSPCSCGATAGSVSMLVVLGVINVYIYANYLGDLHHYLLLSWLILTIGLRDRRRGRGRGEPSASMGPRAGVVQYAILILPVALARLELGEPRPVGQPRRRALRGRGLRGAPAGRRADHLLGRADDRSATSTARRASGPTSACGPTTNSRS